MKKVKYMLVVIILGLVALAVYQNKGFFIEKQSLGINLYFFDYQGPELPNGIYYLAVFLIGVLIAYFSTLPQKFRSRKTIRQLNERIAADEKKIARLEAEAKQGSAGGQSQESESGGGSGSQIIDTEAEQYRE